MNLGGYISSPKSSKLCIELIVYTYNNDISIYQKDGHVHEDITQTREYQTNEFDYYLHLSECWIQLIMRSIINNVQGYPCVKIKPTRIALVTTIKTWFIIVYPVQKILT